MRRVLRCSLHKLDKPIVEEPRAGVDEIGGGIGSYNPPMPFKVEIEQEDDGRWIAEVPDLPGVMVYAQSRDEAIARVQVLSLRVLADRLENGEALPQMDAVFSVVA